MASIRQVVPVCLSHKNTKGQRGKSGVFRDVAFAPPEKVGDQSYPQNVRLVGFSPNVKAVLEDATLSGWLGAVFQDIQPCHEKGAPNLQARVVEFVALPSKAVIEAGSIPKPAPRQGNGPAGGGAGDEEIPF